MLKLPKHPTMRRHTHPLARMPTMPMVLMSAKHPRRIRRPALPNQRSLLRRRRARLASVHRRRGAGVEAHHAALAHGIALAVDALVRCREDGGLSGGRCGGADAGEAPHLAVHVFGDDAFEDFGAHLPEDLAGEPGVATGGVLEAGSLTAQFVCEILEARLGAQR